MKRILLYCIMLLIISLGGCSKDEVTPILEIHTTQYCIGADEGSELSIPFRVNVPYRYVISYADANVDWLSNTMSDVQDGDFNSIKIRLVAKQNTSYKNERTAYLDIHYGNAVERLTIVQEKLQPILQISTKEYEIEPEPNSPLKISFSTNVEWSSELVYTTTGDSWLTMQHTSEKYDNMEHIVLQLVAQEHTSFESERIAYLYITYGDQKTRLVINQQKNPEYENLVAKFDAGFARELQARGYIKDASFITPRELRDITTLNVSASPDELTSLQGIEFFPMLSILDCSSNKLTSLDLNQNPKLIQLRCQHNGLTTINLNECEQLRRLNCSGNELTNIDLTKNIALTYLACRSNNLTTLDVTKNVALDTLICYSNRLNTIDLKNNTALILLNADSNPMTSIDVRANRLLKTLRCFKTKVESLDLSQNPQLKTLDCGYAALTALNVLNNPELDSMYCDNNKITSLDVSRNTKLSFLECSSNVLSKLTLNNPMMITLSCHDNRLQGLDISKNTKLQEFTCNSNAGSSNRFAVKAWFENDAIPKGFTNYDWVYGGKTIQLVYYTGELQPIPSYVSGKRLHGYKTSMGGYPPTYQYEVTIELKGQVQTANPDKYGYGFYSEIFGHIGGATYDNGYFTMTYTFCYYSTSSNYHPTLPVKAVVSRNGEDTYSTNYGNLTF